MANVQKQFEKFHVTIRVDMETSAPLREKRDILVEKIRAHLKANKRPVCSQYGQGSYSMRTGVVPVDIDYDIDVGLMFPFSEKDHTAKDVRSWVREAVKDHTDNVDDRGPCLRVGYADGYHVDLVSYARWDDMFGTDTFRLAHKDNGWRRADPPLLLSKIDSSAARFADLKDSATSTDQFRRCVRCLRRWVDLQYPEEPKHKPTGLGLVLLCRSHLSPTATFLGDPDDRAALESMLTLAGGTFGRIVERKPAPEEEDLFERMDNQQMADFKTRLLTLRDTLKKAGKEPDPTEACTLLADDDAFGPDFPIPPKEETAARATAPAVVRSSSSGA